MDKPRQLRKIDTLKCKKHIKYLKSFLGKLPYATISLDTSRLTLAFFSISGLGLLKSLDFSESERKMIIDWIYGLQVNRSHPTIGNFGFSGSSANGDNKYNFGHLAMTYSALGSLLVLGGDLGRVNRKSIRENMGQLQLENGCFAAVHGSESDMRFVYCAAAICHILSDWTPVNITKMVEFIENSLTYEGAFGQAPGHEAHGGSTYCAVAALVLAGKVSGVLDRKRLERLKRWCIMKQVSGFQGRPNKDPDTCYSFWVGATLKLLNSYHLMNEEENVDFVLSTEDDNIGGLSKFPDNSPDALHSFLGLSGLSLTSSTYRDHVLTPVDPALNIPRIFSEVLSSNEICY